MIEIYIKLSSIAVFLLIVLLLAAIIPFIKLQNEKRKCISELSKTTHDFSQNLKATYKKNDSSYDTESDNSCLSQILKKYKEINNKKITNKCKFSLLTIYVVEISILLPCLCIANLYFKFIEVNTMLSLLKSPFVLLCIFPFLMYIRFVQPRETWTRHSKTTALLEAEFYSYIYHRGVYQTIASSPVQIYTFENRILNIFSNNIAIFSENMKKHTETENSFKNFKI